MKLKCEICGVTNLKSQGYTFKSPLLYQHPDQATAQYVWRWQRMERQMMLLKQ